MSNIYLPLVNARLSQVRLLLGAYKEEQGIRQQQLNTALLDAALLQLHFALPLICKELAGRLNIKPVSACHSFADIAANHAQADFRSLELEEWLLLEQDGDSWLGQMEAQAARVMNPQPVEPKVVKPNDHLIIAVSEPEMVPVRPVTSADIANYLRQVEELLQRQRETLAEY